MADNLPKTRLIHEVIAEQVNTLDLAKADKTDLENLIDGDGVSSIVKLTQAEYDALGTYDATTLYIIVG